MDFVSLSSTPVRQGGKLRYGPQRRRRWAGLSAVTVYMTQLSPSAVMSIHMSMHSHNSVWARGRCRISPPRFLAECCKRQLNQVSLVLLYFRLSAFSDLY